MEFCKGTLYDNIQTHKRLGHPLSEKQVKDVLTQLCEILAPRGTHGVFLTQLNSQDIFFTQYKNLQLQFVQSLPTQGRPTTPPEVREGRPHSAMSDVWFLGRLLSEMCSYHTYYSGHGVPQSVRYDSKGVLVNFSSGLRHIICQALNDRPRRRPSLDDMLRMARISSNTLQDSQEYNNRIRQLKQDARALEAFFTESHQEVILKIRELTQITEELEAMHRRATIGSLSGGVIGAAGNITSVVGLILAPFTLGASLIVTGIGIGIATAGGITGAASNITKMVQSKTFQDQIKAILKYCEGALQPVLNSLTRVTSMGGLQAVVGAGTVLSDIGQIARLSTRAAKAKGVVGQTMPILSSLILPIDVFTIASDAREIHQIRMRETGESVDSQMLKFNDEMKQAAAVLTQAVDEIEIMRAAINNAINM